MPTPRRPASERGVHVGASVEIDRARAAVWEELARIEDHVTWMNDATAIRFVGAQRRGPGTTFECDTRVGPLRLTDVMEITDWDEPSTLAVAHRGVVSGWGRFRLEDGPAGTTSVRWDEHLRFPWWLGGYPGAWVARPLLAALWRANLRRLRGRVLSTR